MSAKPVHLASSSRFVTRASRPSSPVAVGLAEDEITVVRDDLPAFNITEPDDDLISDNVRIVAVRLVSLAFKEDNRWRVNDGTSTFWASLHELDFLQRVTSNEEVFARDDILRVRLREVRDDAGIREVWFMREDDVDQDDRRWTRRSRQSSRRSRGASASQRTLLEPPRIGFEHLATTHRTRVAA